MKKFIFIFLFFLLLGACSGNTENAPEAFSLYYFSDEYQNALTSVKAEFTATSLNDKVDEAFSLLYFPDDNDYISVFTSETKHSSFSVSGNICTVVLPPAYLTVPTTTKVAINTVLTKTLCSISGIDSIVISCDDVNVVYSEDDFIVSPPEIYHTTQSVNLYFANYNFSSLNRMVENISIQSNKTIEHTLVSLLFNDPVSKQLQSPIPKGTKLNDVYVSDGVCFVDFSREFSENIVHSKKHETVLIYSIVNTLTELPSVESVKFLIDGKDAYGFVYFDVSKPFYAEADPFEK